MVEFAKFEDYQNMFIVIEGIDGAGKGRQRLELTNELQSLGQKCTSVEFPDHEGVLYREFIKPTLLQKRKMSKDALFLSFALDQVLYSGAIAKAKGSRSEHFICDGYFTTNLVYNALVNKFISLEKALDFAKTFNLEAADLNIFIDTEPEVALSRKKIEPGHLEGLDIYERDLNKQRELRAAYLKMAAENVFGSWQIVPGNGSIIEVKTEIISLLKKHKLIFD